MITRRTFIAGIGITAAGLFGLSTLAGKFEVLKREPVDYDAKPLKTDQPFDYAQDFKDYFNNKNSLLTMMNCESIKDPGNFGHLLRGLVIDNPDRLFKCQIGRAKYWCFIYEPNHMADLKIRDKFYRDVNQHIHIAFNYNRG